MIIFNMIWSEKHQKMAKNLLFDNQQFQFTFTWDEEKQKILTFEKLKPANTLKTIKSNQRSEELLSNFMLINEMFQLYLRVLSLIYFIGKWPSYDTYSLQMSRDI